MNTRRRILARDVDSREVLLYPEAAFCRIYSANARSVDFSFGSSKWRIILNGVDLGKKSNPITLAAGWNSIYLFMDNTDRLGGTFGSLLTYLRFPQYTPNGIHGAFAYSSVAKLVDIPMEVPYGDATNMLRKNGVNPKKIRVWKGLEDTYKNSSTFSKFSSIIVGTNKFSDYQDVLNTL